MRNIMTYWGITITCFICMNTAAQSHTQQTKNTALTSRAFERNIRFDTMRTKKHSPRFAAISSAIIPGTGQLYNKKYWKTPIIIGVGLGAYVRYEHYNTLFFQYKNAYNNLKSNKEVTTPFLQNKSSDELYFFMDKYRRKKELTLIYSLVFYAANIIDAYVDAYLLDYDVSENLSLRCEPSIMAINPTKPDTFDNKAYGVNFQLYF